MFRRNDIRQRSQDGIALLMVLWVLTILMVIAFSFSLAARTETHSTLTFKERVENKFAAEACMERAIMEIFFRRQNLNLEGSDIWIADSRPYTVEYAGGNCSVKIFDESGKVDINIASDVTLKNLFSNIGVPAEQADIIVDSIMDWKDPDDLHRLHGAESEYYMSLPRPYKAKNANFDTIEELLLVKGVKREMLYGNSEHKGISDMLTVHSRMQAVNINTVSKEILISIPGITPEIAEGIINFRNSKKITNLQEAGVPNESTQYFHIIETNTYTIESLGYRDKEKKGYAIRATVVITGNNNYKYVYYKSPESIN